MLLQAVELVGGAADAHGRQTPGNPRGVSTAATEDSCVPDSDALAADAAAAYRATLHRMVNGLTEEQRRALREGGSTGLWWRMCQEHEDALPEIKKTRPKVVPNLVCVRVRPPSSCLHVLRAL